MADHRQRAGSTTICWFQHSTERFGLKGVTVLCTPHLGLVPGQRQEEYIFRQGGSRVGEYRSRSDGCINDWSHRLAARIGCEAASTTSSVITPAGTRLPRSPPNPRGAPGGGPLSAPQQASGWWPRGDALFQNSTLIHLGRGTHHHHRRHCCCCCRTACRIAAAAEPGAPGRRSLPQR